MANEIKWLESFTGLAVDSGSAIPGVNPEAAAARFELKKSQQRLMLVDVRKQLGTFKSDFQNAMSEKIKSGKLKGERLLKESGTQIEEVEAEDLSIADLAVSDESKKLIAQGSFLVTKLSL